MHQLTQSGALTLPAPPKAHRREFGTIERRGHHFYAVISWQGRRIRRAAASRAIAARKLSEAHAAMARGVPLQEVLVQVFGDIGGSRVTFRQVQDLFLDARRPRWKISTYLGSVKRLRLICTSPWAGAFLSAIRPEDITRWVYERQKKVCGATINRDLCMVSALFRWAIGLGYVQENPVRRIERFDERGRERETYLTSAEARALVKAASSMFRPLLVTALSTGARRGELLALRWKDIDFVRNEIVIRPETEKTGRGRVIPMTSDLRCELMAIHGALKIHDLLGEDHVFADGSGQPLKIKDVRRFLPAALAVCNEIPHEKRGKVTFHTFRHTAASLMVAAGVPIFDVAKILGHGSINITARRYAHFSPEAGRAAVEKLGKSLSLGEVERDAKREAEGDAQAGG